MNNQSTPKKKNVGGIWVKTSANSNTYLSISVEINGVKHNFVAFKNDKGDNEKRPDYSVFPREEKTNEVPF